MLFAAVNSLSEQSLVAPYKLMGAAALSVDKATTRLTPVSRQASTTFCAPKTLVLMNSKGLYSAVGSRHLLKRGGMDDGVNAFQCTTQAAGLANIADEVAQGRIVRFGEVLRHLKLLD